MIEPTDPEMLPPARPAAPAPAGGGGAASAGAPGADAPAFTGHLDRAFHGPLDLLLQLVRERELEIHLVSLGEVCDAFVAHLAAMPAVDVDEAADWLVIAATLLAIKSRALLPTEEIEPEEDLFDPGEELVQQLLAYKELRRVCDELAARRAERAKLKPAGGRWLGRAAQPAADEEDEDDAEGVDLGDVSLWDLFKAIARLEEETGFLRPHRVRPMAKPLRAYVEDLWLTLQELGETSLLRLLRERKAKRHDGAYTFVALLELARQQQVDLEQPEPFGDVHVRRVEGAGEVRIEEVDPEFDRQEALADAEVEELLEETPGSEPPPPGA